ncbi:MAG: hypothetical protein L0211_15870 [Planctomycetaceae bacterium]|nr:hypothetical protein [Planctomycetaceae bacterium]
MLRRTPARTLRFESLEDRYALAGNVVVALTEGRLTILGDDQANGVNIVYDVATQKHIVSGRDMGGSATQVNGGAASVEFTGVKHVQVWLSAGDDCLDFGATDQLYTTIAQKLVIDMGSGNDTVELGRAGNNAGAADPVLHRLYVNKGIYVDLGPGDDDLEVANLKTNKSLIVKAGDGNDEVTFATEFTPTGAPGTMMFPVLIKGNLHVHLGMGDDTLTLLHAAVGQNVKINDPAGVSIISIADVVGNEKININTGNANDMVILDYVRADDLSVKTAGGEDEVKIEHSRFKRINVQLGGGQDDLTIRTSRSTQGAYLDGGDQGADFSQRNNALRGLMKRRLS